MSYVLSSNGHAPGYNVARRYMGSYMARDYIAPLMRVYGGRLVPTAPLTFDSVEEAENYLQNNKWLSGAWEIVPFDCCMNCLVKEGGR